MKLMELMELGFPLLEAKLRFSPRETVDGSEIRSHPLRLIVSPIVNTVSLHPRWCRIACINSILGAGFLKFV